MADPGRDAFVGRGPELKVLRTALADGAAGRPRVVLVRGEPGIGKSRFIEEVAGEARASGAEILVGRCFEGEGAPAFWPWLQILREWAAARDDDTLTVEAGAGAADLAAAYPELCERLPGLSVVAGDGDPEQRRFRLFEAFAALLGRATHPIVVALDDLHGADVPSLHLLLFLARHLGPARVLLIGALRDTAIAPEDPIRDVLDELICEPTTELIILHGLSPAEVGQLAAYVLGALPPAGMVEALSDATSGNPLYVIEVMRAFASDGDLDESRGLRVPETLKVAIGRRLARLSPACRDLLVWAALFGRDFDAGTLARAAGLAGSQVLALLDEAVASHLVDDVAGQPTRYRFTHAVVFETLAASLSGARRAALHRGVAEALAAEANADEHAAEIAHHYFAAGLASDDVAHTARWASRAGDQALERLAYEEAARLYALGLAAVDRAGEADGTPRVALLLRLGEARKRAGDVDPAKAAFLRAAELARKTGSPSDLTRAALGYAPVVSFAERPTPDPVLVRLLEDAIAAWGGEASGLRALAMARLAAAGVFTMPFGERVALLEAAVAMARRVDDRDVLRQLLAAQHWATWSPAVERMLPIATELVQLAERAGDRELLARGRMFRCVDLVQLGDFAAVDYEFALFSRLAEDLRQPVWSWYVHLFEALRALLEGRFADAEREASAALVEGQRALPYAAPASYTGQIAVIRVWQGRAAELLDAWRAVIEAHPAPGARSSLVWLEAACGNLAEVRLHLDRMAADGFGALERDITFPLVLCLLTEGCAAVDDAERAAQLRPLLAPFAGRWVMWSEGVCMGPATLFLGMLARLKGKLDEAVAHLDDALAVTTRAGARPLAVRVRYELARTLFARRGPGDVDRARALAHEALAAAAALGLSAMASQLRALGGVPDGADVDVCVFRRDGAWWTIAYEGKTVRLADARGLQYLARLLRSPHDEVSAEDLMGGTRKRGGPSERSDAIAALKRVETLRREVAEADASNDLGRVSRLRAALEEAEDDIAAQAHAHPSRTREAARLAVTKAIKAALDRLEEVHPSLAQHLWATVRRGYVCVYAPDPRRPIEWRSDSPGR